jgi:hypothetical protein
MFSNGRGDTAHYFLVLLGPRRLKRRYATSVYATGNFTGATTPTTSSTKYRSLLCCANRPASVTADSFDSWRLLGAAPPVSLHTAQNFSLILFPFFVVKLLHNPTLNLTAQKQRSRLATRYAPQILLRHSGLH